MTDKPSRKVLSSSIFLAVSGTIFIALDLYFIFLRPPLLPEDPRYMGASFQQIQANLPGLSIWLSRVFWVLGGYMTATGILTCHLALTSFRAKLPGTWWIAALSGAVSIGMMSAVNFLIDSDFKWLLFLFTWPWLAALVLFRVESRNAPVRSGKRKF